MLLPATPWCNCWYTWSCPRGSLQYSHFLWIFFILLFWLDIFASLYSKLLIWFSAASTPLFPVNCSLFQLVYSSYLTGSFSWFWCHLYAVELLTKFIEQPHNQHFDSASTRLLISFCLVLFLEFCSVLLFGPCFFVSSFWQPPCVCCYILGELLCLLGFIKWPYILGVL